MLYTKRDQKQVSILFRLIITVSNGFVVAKEKVAPKTTASSGTKSSAQAPVRKKARKVQQMEFDSDDE